MMLVDKEKLNDSQVNELGHTLGLRPSEVEHIKQHLQRLPGRCELTLFAGMWSEHCSYKSTLPWLSTLPRQADCVLAGPGSHAGTVHVGDGWAVAFKVESHNHPSAVEPYQGAATGVGGILRDIIAQGARPVAVMDGLCFGDPTHPHVKHLRQGVVAGIAGYGNAFGVPNIGGSTQYDPSYHGNPLVNALAAGLVRPDAMRTGNAQGIGNAVLYVGAATGRDGILGAAFASEELADDTVEDRPHVQVGDPFTGKKLMEACLSFTPEMGMVACQDMGACGLTCAAIEMAAQGNVGMAIDLQTIPLRQDNMAPEEILLSESQERFLFVVQAGKEAQAIAHFESHGVLATICGHVVEGTHVQVSSGSDVYVDMPAELLADGAPLSNWPIAASLPEVSPVTHVFDAPTDLGITLTQLLATPTLGSHENIYQHYDQTVGNRTVRGPGNSSAAVLKLPNSQRGFALRLTCRGDLCAVDPQRGAEASLAEAYRHLVGAGAKPIAITDGLNMASPRDSHENLKLKLTIAGLKSGLEQLELPVTGGNVSLYNESSAGPIIPTPIIGALGTVADIRRVPSHGFQDNQIIFSLGLATGQPVASQYTWWRGAKTAAGYAVDVDLDAEKRLGQFLLQAIELDLIRACRPIAQGGQAIALAKLCVRGGCGARLQMPALPHAGRRDWQLFGEYAAMAVISTTPEMVPQLQTLAKQLGQSCTQLGQTTATPHFIIEDILDVSVQTLAQAYHCQGAEQSNA